jgi:glucose/arabinose dehydrogenase
MMRATRRSEGDGRLRARVLGLAIAAALGAGLAQAEGPTPSPAARSAAAARFATTCAACHGLDANGGQGPPLLRDKTLHGDDDASLTRSIRDGYPAHGMPAFGSMLSEAQIGELVAFLREKRAAAAGGEISKITAGIVGVQGVKPPAGVQHTDRADFTVETVAQVGYAFGFAFLPDGKILITEAGGALRIVDAAGAEPRTIAGTPFGGPTVEYFHRRMLDVSLHPDFRKNGWIYLIVSAPAEAQPPAATHMIALTLHRGRIRGERWVDDQALLTFGSEISSSARMAWDRQGFLYVGTNWSDYYREGPAEKAPPQDLSSPYGKVLRLTDEGKVPPDNPFAGKAGAYPYVWSYGHRVPVGLAFDRNGALWETENGPRGGDEVNHIQRGHNYGWPVITWGHIYEDKAELAHPEAPGMDQPVVNFDPSPGLGGVAVYTGDAFPGWKDNLFVGSLKDGDLFRLVVAGDREVLLETVLHQIGRIRALATGPDGLLYVLIDSGTLLRLRPAKG